MFTELGGGAKPPYLRLHPALLNPGLCMLKSDVRIVENIFPAARHTAHREVTWRATAGLRHGTLLFW